MLSPSLPPPPYLCAYIYSQQPHTDTPFFSVCCGGSGWILTSCQPCSHLRMIKRCHMHSSKPLLIDKPFLKSIYTINPYTNLTQNIQTQTLNTNFQRVSPFNISPVKRTHEAKTCWYHQPFRLIYWHQIKDKHKQEMARSNNKIKTKMLYKCIMVNISVIRQQAAHTTDHQTSPSCWKRGLQKNLTLFENGPLAEKLQERKNKRTRQKIKRS